MPTPSSTTVHASEMTHISTETSPELKQTARKLSIGAVMGLAIITARSSGLEIIDSG